jgi:hypothetical protein
MSHPFCFPKLDLAGVGLGEKVGFAGESKVNENDVIK